MMLIISGSLKYVFFNDKSIIYELKRSNPMVHYIGVLEPEFYDADVDVIPITYPFAGSHIWWPITSTDSLQFNFDFKSSKPVAVVASGDVKSEHGLGYWEVITLGYIYKNLKLYNKTFKK